MRTLTALIAAAVLTFTAQPAAATHDYDWDLLAAIDWDLIPQPEPTYGGLTAAQWLEIGELIAETPPPPAPVDPIPEQAFAPDVEQAIVDAAAEFGVSVWVTSEVVRCESRGIPGAQNPRSSASGLYQFLDSTWAAFAPRLGYSVDRATQYDATASARVGAMVIAEGGIGHWAPWSGSCSSAY